MPPPYGGITNKLCRKAAQYAPAHAGLQVDNIFVIIRQVTQVLFRHVGYLRHQQQVNLWRFDLD